MCTSPILIRNRKYKYTSLKLEKMYMQVPCGHCDECLSKRANDIYVRARYEFDFCLENGGCGFMCCLTYNDNQLPLLEYNGKSYMVFNKKHLIDFIKRLRSNLSRQYKKLYGIDAPKFKYLITSEYGADPTRTHRPHYHLLFFFEKSISLALFERVFTDSKYIKCGKDKHSVFGIIQQCDPLDPSKGGIKYSGKYILKDLSFENQRKIINDIINFKTRDVNIKFNICFAPSSFDEELQNQCIRSSKDYRKAITSIVTPYRHMLQFYMLSNDLGVSYIIEKYGSNLLETPTLNFEGVPYSLPRLVKQRIEKVYGYPASDKISKRIFNLYFEKAADFAVENNYISSYEASQLKDFVSVFVQPFSGELVFLHPDFDFRQFGLSNSLVDWQELLKCYNFYFENDFYNLRSSVLRVISHFNSPENLKIRARDACQRSEVAKERYNRKKYNQPKNF